jgi:hypothetical protein
MSRSDYRTLITRGRKAGLSTREIYSALAGHPPEGDDVNSRLGDGNGFVSDYTAAGQRVYRPMDGTARS